MESPTRDYQQMAIAILAIATAALGFALWAQDFDPVPPESGQSWQAWLYWAEIAAIVIAVVCYFATFTMVLKLLRRYHPVTGQDLVRYPLVWLYAQMAVLAFLFLTGYASDLIVAWDSGAMPTPEPPAQSQ